jgi:hypothetical protein
MTSFMGECNPVPCKGKLDDYPENGVFSMMAKLKI